MQHRGRGLSFALGCLLAGPLPAQNAVSLSATRVSGAHVDELARFYHEAFGLQQFQRLTLPNGRTEIAMNFGASAAAARSNPATQVLILQRDSDDSKDPPEVHLLFSVKDIGATVAAVVRAGGRMAAPPRNYGQLTVGVAMDPAGNRIELVQGYSGRKSR